MTYTDAWLAEMWPPVHELPRSERESAERKKKSADGEAECHFTGYPQDVRDE